MPAEALPERIGQYKILSRLGAGGMGEVFLGEDPRLGRRVAIKRPLPQALASPEAAHRLLTEARAAARLDHPNVCGIYEVGEDADGPFIVMPFVEGETLASLLEKGPLPIERAVALSLQAAEALAAAHAQGVLHRDIKPANVIVGATGQLRIMDFGLAKVGAAADVAASAAATALQMTTPGTTIGTVAYMSPEQARGERLDGRSDLFSLGIVLYEMVAGRRPFDGRSAAEILAGLLTADPPLLGSVRSETPGRLEEIVAKLLRRAPAERYQSAQDLTADLRDVSTALSGSSRAALSRSGAARPAGQRSRATLLGAAAVLVMIIGAVAVGTWLTLRPPTTDTQVMAERIAIDSLAVLPFTDTDKTPDREYVADGITESLIRNLAQVPKLKVISRNTVFRFKNRNAEARAIAKELGVRAVMTGTIGRVDGQMVIDIELSSVEDDTVLFSQRYVQDPAHVLKAQSDISQDVVHGLKVLVTGEDEQRLAKQATSSRDAYEFFLRGRFFENQLTPPSLQKAIDQYRLAIAADPSYALAYTELAGAYLFLGIYFESPTESMTAARNYAQQALAIDPQMADPHVILGMVKLLFDWDYPAAAHELISVGGLTEQSLGILGCTAHLLESGGKLDDAEHTIQRALASDPLSIGLNTEVGCGAYYRRKYDEAIQGYRRALELEPMNDVAYWGLGKALAAKEMYGEALAELNKAGKMNGVPAPIILSELGYSHAKAGQTAEARKILSQMSAPDSPYLVDPYLIAIVTIGLGDIDETFRWLDKAYTVRSAFIPSLIEEPRWDVLKSDPRFKALTKRVGFV